jgi:hypothetical protein
LPGSVLTLKSPRDFQGLGDSVLDFREAITLIRHATIIIHTGTTSGRTTLIPSRIRTITAVRDTPGIMAIGLITAIIITTTIEPMSQRTVAIIA